MAREDDRSRNGLEVRPKRIQVHVELDNVPYDADLVGTDLDLGPAHERLFDVQGLDHVLVELDDQAHYRPFTGVDIAAHHVAQVPSVFGDNVLSLDT